MRSLPQRDARVLWHPYTQHAIEGEPLAVVGAHDALLRLDDGREIVDAISSWWTCLHGHGHPALADALTRQARTLDHVLFAGATHEPAVALAEALLRVAPKGLARVFYSDDGSTAVEVALKVVLQSWRQRGEPARTTFVALDGGYHGDTFGAMAVSDPDPFFAPFAPFLFRVERAAADALAVASALEKLGERAAGVIVEPLVQGAGGMRMHDAATLCGIRAACDRFGVPLVADEVMTGFGRTGALFACRTADVSPDVMCLAKGLTGGIFPLAATLVSERLFEHFLSSDRARAFFHGHSFTGSPIGCAVALASLALCETNDVPSKLARIGERIESELRATLTDDRSRRSLRRCGGIVAFDLVTPRAGYLATDVVKLRAAAIDAGVLLRPLGSVVYAMPPACTSEAQCASIARAMVAVERASERVHSQP